MTYRVAAESSAQEMEEWAERAVQACTAPGTAHYSISCVKPDF